MAAKQGDQETPLGETLKYKTWVLRVLIHCDGCKKKVKKVLHGIDGVYTTDVDSQQHKVTVTGNVEAETLIKKLERTGKYAEIWPQIKPPEKKDSNKMEKEEKKKNNEGVGDGGNNNSNEGCIDIPDEESDHNDECKENGNGGGSEGGKKKKKKKKKKGNGNGDSAPPNDEKVAVVVGGGGGGGGGEESSKVDAGAVGSSNKVTSVASREMIGPPIQQAYPSYPQQMYYSVPLPNPPTPYGLSYNTAYPVTSASSYYVDAPIMPMHASNNIPFPHLHPPPPPSHIINHYADDNEYEAGCSIM